MAHFLKTRVNKPQILNKNSNSFLLLTHQFTHLKVGPFHNNKAKSTYWIYSNVAEPDNSMFAYFLLPHFSTVKIFPYGVREKNLGQIHSSRET